MRVVSRRWSVLSKSVFSVALSTLFVARCLPVHAQQEVKIPKIGFIGVRPDAANYSGKSILHELQKFGYVEGKTFIFEYRTAENQLDVFLVWSIN